MALTPQFGSIVPSQLQQTLPSAYISFNEPGGGGNFAQQYLPELYEAEVERYGNRTLSGFLRMVGAELPMTSDQVIWSEQNRLHVAYENCTFVSATGVITLDPGGVQGTSNVISLQQTVVVLDDFGNEAKCLVVGSTPGLAGTITVEPYTAATLAAAGLQGTVKVFVYGSEYPKGTNTTIAGTGAQAIAGNDYPIITVEPAFTQFSNKPIIIRNNYSINGSDTAQIGWVEVAT